jgi:hypothetical protein
MSNRLAGLSLAALGVCLAFIGPLAMVPIGVGAVMFGVWIAVDRAA